MGDEAENLEAEGRGNGRCEMNQTTLPPATVQDLIGGGNMVDDDGSFGCRSKARAAGMVKLGLATLDAVSYGVHWMTITEAGTKALKSVAYCCWGCGDWTTGTRSRIREYPCCPDCIRRVTNMREPDDDDPGPFRPRRFAPPESIEAGTPLKAMLAEVQ